MNKSKRLSDKEIRTRGLEALHRIREQASKNKHEFTLDEINEIIAETRKENNHSFIVNDAEEHNKKLKEAYEESMNETDKEDMKTFLNRLKKNIRAYDEIRNENDKFMIAAKKILKRYHKAFEELAK